MSKLEIIPLCTLKRYDKVYYDENIRLKVFAMEHDNSEESIISRLYEGNGIILRVFDGVVIISTF